MRFVRISERVRRDVARQVITQLRPQQAGNVGLARREDELDVRAASRLELELLPDGALDALRKGLTALLSYVLVQLLTGFMMMSVLFLAVGVGGLIHPVFGLGLGFYLAAQAYARFVLAGAVIVSGVSSGGSRRLPSA